MEPSALVYDTAAAAEVWRRVAPAIPAYGAGVCPAGATCPLPRRETDGEVKRIEIATILARRGQLMIFDEPEAGIDLWSFARLTETFEQIHREGEATMIIISHQERIIRLADEIVVIAGGKIAHRGSTEEIFPLILADTLGSCPVLDRKEGAQ